MGKRGRHIEATLCWIAGVCIFATLAIKRGNTINAIESGEKVVVPDAYNADGEPIRWRIILAAEHAREGGEGEK